MEKVTIKSLNSANVRMDNSVDAGRVYDISANVNINTGNQVQSIDVGSVKDKQSQNEVCSFSSWGGDNLQMNYNGVDAEKQCAIITEVNAFIEAVRAKASAGEMLSMAVVSE